MKPKPAVSGPLSMLHNIPAMISNSAMPSTMITSTQAVIPSALTEAETTSINSPAPTMLTSYSSPSSSTVPSSQLNTHSTPSSQLNTHSTTSSKLLTDSVLSMISSPVSNMISAIASSIKHSDHSSPSVSELVEATSVSPSQTITIKDEPSTPSIKERVTGIEAMIQNFLSPFKNLPDPPPKEVYNLPRQDLDIPPNVTVNSSQLLPDIPSNKEQQGYRKKMMRCKECENCLRPNCGKCMYCLDMKKFGGNNSLRQTCIHRKCLNVSLPRASDAW